MGDKKKHRDRSRSQDKKKSKKKGKQSRKDKEKEQKSRRKRSSSSSQTSSDNSSSERSRQRQKQKKNKKKKKESQKQQKQTIAMPFSIPQSTPVITSSLTALRPGGIVIPPPSTPAPVVVASTKPKTKESHIFKLLPKLPIGCITIGRTIYSSSLLSEGFQNKMVNSICEQLQRSARAQGSKKMASMISKVKIQINELQTKQKQEDAIAVQQKQKQFENQFHVLSKTYTNEIRKIKENFLLKQTTKTN